MVRGCNGWRREVSWDVKVLKRGDAGYECWAEAGPYHRYKECELTREEWSKSKYCCLWVGRYYFLATKS